MKSIRNKTHAPLRVPLPRGKVLHLGPNQTGHINHHAADHPPLLKLVEAEKIELFDDSANDGAETSRSGGVHASTQGMGPSTTRRTGER